MQTDQLIEILRELAQVDIDAVHSYNRVLDEISDNVVRARLTSFRDEHQQHMQAIADEIRTLGGEVPESTKDFKGYAVEAFAVLRTTTGGMKNALKALKTAEEITNRYYSRKVSKEAPAAVKDLLRKHFSEEKIHLDYINENVKAF